jgi:hypothetical protein
MMDIEDPFGPGVPEIIGTLTAQAKPISFTLDQVFLARNKVIFGLLGRCSDADSADAKSDLALNIYETLRKSFNINPRPYEIDPKKLDHVHSSLGIIKRPPPVGYVEFARRLTGLEFKPISATVAELYLVHTKRAWTVAFPQRGLQKFPLGAQPTILKNESVKHLRFD